MSSAADIKPEGRVQHRQRPRRLHDQVVEALGSEIVSGRIPPGATLDPEYLEGELGVSRTALREALRVLGAKGLVAARPKRGTYVRQRDEWRMLDRDILRWRGETADDMVFLEDLSELRRIVEPAAAELAAARHSAADIDALESALAAMEAAEANADAEATTAADLDFHRALLAASGNELLQQLELVITTALDARDRLVHASGDWSSAVADHRAVLDSIAGRSPGDARARMIFLLDRSGRDAEDALDRRER